MRVIILGILLVGLVGSAQAQAVWRGTTTDQRGRTGRATVKGVVDPFAVQANGKWTCKGRGCPMKKGRITAECLLYVGGPVAIFYMTGTITNSHGTVQIEGDCDRLVSFGPGQWTWGGAFGTFDLPRLQ